MELMELLGVRSYLDLEMCRTLLSGESRVWANCPGTRCTVQRIAAAGAWLACQCLPTKMPLVAYERNAALSSSRCCSWPTNGCAKNYSAKDQAHNVLSGSEVNSGQTHPSCVRPLRMNISEGLAAVLKISENEDDWRCLS
jgi:hypothetical protein